MVERRGDVRLVLIDHPGEGLQLRCPPMQAPCPPGPEGFPQLRRHLRRPRAVESFPHSRLRSAMLLERGYKAKDAEE